MIKWVMFYLVCILMLLILFAAFRAPWPINLFLVSLLPAASVLAWLWASSDP